MENMAAMELTAARLGQAYSDHGRALLRFLARRTFDAEVAVDLTAETFARACEGRRRFRGSSSQEIEAWLYAIARNVLADFARRGRVERTALRKMGVERPGVDDAEIARVEDLAGFAALRLRVAGELDRLTGTQRRAVELRVLEERSYEEMAAELGISEQAARANVSRGLRALAKRLEEARAMSLEEVSDV